MIVECRKCGHQLDPNDESTVWASPFSPDSADVGSIVCPSCSNRDDFSKWKSLTAATEPKND